MPDIPLYKCQEVLAVQGNALGKCPRKVLKKYLLQLNSQESTDKPGQQEELGSDEEEFL